jgi:hypothetical protein
MKALITIGVVLAVLGIGSLVFPAFSTSHTHEVAKLGSVTVQNRESVLHVIPTAASIAAIVVGGGLVAAGVASSNRG